MAMLDPIAALAIEMNEHYAVHSSPLMASSRLLPSFDRPSGSVATYGHSFEEESQSGNRTRVPIGITSTINTTKQC